MCVGHEKMPTDKDIKIWLERVKSGHISEMEKVKRPTWDEYFAKIVVLISKRSTCIYFREGAIVVRDRRILATGYAGSPSGFEHCTDVGCTMPHWRSDDGWPPICRGLHAIQNAIIQGAIFDISISKSVIYTNNEPCTTCAKMLVNTGIKGLYLLKSRKDAVIDGFVHEILGKGNVVIKYLEDMDIRDEYMGWIFE